MNSASIAAHLALATAKSAEISYARIARGDMDEHQTKRGAQRATLR